MANWIFHYEVQSVPLLPQNTGAFGKNEVVTIKYAQILKHYLNTLIF
jgi:hypothetical protein